MDTNEGLRNGVLLSAILSAQMRARCPRPIAFQETPSQLKAAALSFSTTAEAAGIPSAKVGCSQGTMSG